MHMRMAKLSQAPEHKAFRSQGSKRTFERQLLIPEVRNCFSNPCDANATCIDTEESFICTCLSGLTGNGIICSSMSMVLMISFLSTFQI